MTDPVTDLERFMMAVISMRQAQRDFFARGKQTDKKIAIGLEIHVDQLLRQLKRKGYNPDIHKESTEQKKMF